MNANNNRLAVVFIGDVRAAMQRGEVESDTLSDTLVDVNGVNDVKMLAKALREQAAMCLSEDPFATAGLVDKIELKLNEEGVRRQLPKADLDFGYSMLEYSIAVFRGECTLDGLLDLLIDLSVDIKRVLSLGVTSRCAD